MMKAFDTQQDLSGATVVLRAALNAPFEHGTVSNTFRLLESLATIETLLQQRARVVILGHIGREPELSLKPVWEEMKKHTSFSITFVDDLLGGKAEQAVRALKDGAAVMLENVRSVPGEKKNDPEVGARLASYGDVFVNDAFADSHRTHASIVGIPKHIPGFAGPNFMKEYEGIFPARTPTSPSLAIIGGAKFETKQPLILRLLETYDRLFIGGALANDFLAAKGYEVGTSLVSRSPDIQTLLDNEKLMFPADVVVSCPDGKMTTRACDAVLPNETILDVGPASVKALALHVAEARTILWNGPLGYFEGGYKDATESLAKLVAESGAVSIIGGGDTVSAIHDLNIADRFTHVSTAGGAMLQFITDGTLPGIEALK